MQFLKGHSTGNDFVLLPDPHGTLELSREEIIRICDRREGLGADGILHVLPTSIAAPQLGGRAEWYMEHWNADGSPAPMCGNGIRLQGRYLVDGGHTAPGEVWIGTRSGVYHLDVPRRGDVSVDLGEPTFKSAEYPLPDRTRVELKTAHEVVIVETLPEGGELVGEPEVNVEYVQVLSPNRLKMRVVERGVGETLSCGTGAAAAVAAASRMRHLDEKNFVVETRGGELRITREGERLSLTGGAQIVAEGDLRELRT